MTVELVTTSTSWNFSAFQTTINRLLHFQLGRGDRSSLTTLFMTLFTWTAESRSFLNNETRIQQFDFERVAKAVRDRFSHLSCEVSPDQCRLAFAEDFTSTLPPDIMRETSMLNIDDSMSFDQVMNIVEIRNERNELRKKKTFDRILASLGPMTVSSVSGSDEHNLIKSNMAEKRMQEEHERCRRNEITAKKNEISRVEMEREILRQRKLAPTSGSLGRSCYIRIE